MKKTDQRVFILIGRSGCGKGTQGKLIMKRLAANSADAGQPREVLYVQTGAELREFVKGDSATQKLSREIQTVGGLQPEFLAVYMWVNVLVNRYHGTEHIIMDGMPRKVHEAGVVNSIFDFYKLEKATVIHLDVSKKWSIDRLMARKREDDTREDIERRLSWYETEVEPTIEFFKKEPGYKLITVSGERSVEEVFADIVEKAGL